MPNPPEEPVSPRLHEKIGWLCKLCLSREVHNEDFLDYIFSCRDVCGTKTPTMDIETPLSWKPSWFNEWARVWPHSHPLSKTEEALGPTRVQNKVLRNYQKTFHSESCCAGRTKGHLPGYYRTAWMPHVLRTVTNMSQEPVGHTFLGGYVDRGADAEVDKCILSFSPEGLHEGRRSNHHTR